MSNELCELISEKLCRATKSEYAFGPIELDVDIFIVVLHVFSASLDSHRDSNPSISFRKSTISSRPKPPVSDKMW